MTVETQCGTVVSGFAAVSASLNATAIRSNSNDGPWTMDDEHGTYGRNVNMVHVIFEHILGLPIDKMTFHSGDLARNKICSLLHLPDRISPVAYNDRPKKKPKLTFKLLSFSFYISTSV